MTSSDPATPRSEPHRRAATRPASTPSAHISILAVLVGLLMVSLPVSAGASLAGAASQDRDAARLARIENRLTRLESALRDLRTEIEQVRIQIDNSLQPLRVRLADRGEELRQLRSRMAALEERLALTDERLAELPGGGAGEGDATEREPTSPMPPPRGPTGMERPAVAETPESGTATRDENAYRGAYIDYLRGDYGLAISGFEEFVRRHPDSDRVDNALYWIGECHWAQGNFRDALDTFERIGREHPEGDSAPDALLKGALSLLELEEVEPAVDRMRRLIESHPTSEPARLACGQLRRLGRELPARCPSPEEADESR